MASGSSAPPQQINVTDLDVPQLADVRKQLDEVRPTASPRKARLTLAPPVSPSALHPLIGAHPSVKLIRTATTSAGQVQGMH